MSDSFYFSLYQDFTHVSMLEGSVSMREQGCEIPELLDFHLQLFLLCRDATSVFINKLINMLINYIINRIINTLINSIDGVCDRMEVVPVAEEYGKPFTRLPQRF